MRPGVADVWESRTMPAHLCFRIPRFNAMMGAQIPDDFIVDVLGRLGCQVTATDDADVLDVVAPTFRPDLEREIDLYEEVLRLWGMDRVQPTLPGGRGRVGTRSRREHVLDTVNHALRASGLNETMTYSFAEPGDMDRLGMTGEDAGAPVELLNPLNAEQSVMRRSIVPGLLRSVAYNQSRGVANVQLYEVGTVFFAREGKKSPKERTYVAGVLAGAMAEGSWNAAPQPFDFFDAKGVVEIRGPRAGAAEATVQGAVGRRGPVAAARGAPPRCSPAARCSAGWASFIPWPRGSSTPRPRWPPSSCRWTPWRRAPVPPATTWTCPPSPR